VRKAAKTNAAAWVVEPRIREKARVQSTSKNKLAAPDIKQANNRILIIRE
jgi:hypothetical protein